MIIRNYILKVNDVKAAEIRKALNSADITVRALSEVHNEEKNDPDPVSSGTSKSGQETTNA